MNHWIREYNPKTRKDIVGQDKAIAHLASFVENYKKSKKKACIIFGPSGCGKTASVYAIGNEQELEIVEVNASDVRNKAQIDERIGAAMKQMSLFSSGKLILIDEIDGIAGNEDRGGVSEIASLIKESPFPVVMTANDPFDQKLSSLRTKSEMIEFEALSYADIHSRLKEICAKEKIKFKDDDLKTLSRRAGGDLRAAINDLQTLIGKDLVLTKESIEELSQRNRIESVENALLKVFKTTDPSIAVNAFENVDEDIDKLMLWIDENLPKEYTKPEDLARAYENISKADIYRGRIRRWQHWQFLVYVNALMTAGVSVAKDEKYKVMNDYKQTTRILKIWQANMKYQKRKAIAEKIAAKTHSSRKVVIRDVMPYMQEICKKSKKDAERMKAYFELGPEEIEWMVK